MAEQAEWLNEALAKVALCLPLQKNWDSYGGYPIARRSMERAVEALETLSATTDVPKPSVVPTCDGSMAFDWDYGGDQHLEIEFELTGKMSLWLSRDGPEPKDVKTIREMDDATVQDVIDIFRGHAKETANV